MPDYSKGQDKSQNYLHGAAILAAGVVIMKILGAIYKIPLRNILGDVGYGYFYAAYAIYTVLLTISTAGLPVALSRIISEETTLGNGNQARRTFIVAFATLAILGLAFSLVMFLFPEQMADLLVGKEAEVAPGVLALAPSVFLLCICSAFRGYTQGYSDMIPTTVSQVVEVLVKVIVGLVLAWWFTSVGRSLPDSSAGAVFGVTVGSFAALLYMAYKYIVRRRHVSGTKYSDVPAGYYDTFKKFIKVGVPITLGASVMSIVSLLDTKLVNEQLIVAGLSKGLAEELYGSYSAMMTLFNFPASFIVPLSISVVPAISAALTAHRKREAGEIAESSMRIGSVIAMPMAVGLSVLAYPIVNVLYTETHEIGPTILTLLGIASFFVCFTLITNAILQANGNEKLPMISMLAGGVVKLAVNWALLQDPDINILGAPIGTICCYVVMCIMNCVFLKKCMARKPSFVNVFVRPLISSAAMGGVAWAAYGLLSGLIGGADTGRMIMMICMVLAIAVAVIVYLVLVIAIRAITLEDMKLIPKGEKIARRLKIR